MTFRKFIFFTVLQWILLLVLKAMYFKWETFGNVWTSDLAYFVLAVVVATALVRRFGVINYLEAIFVMFFWFLTDILLDFFVVMPILGSSMFSKWQFWAGHFVIMFSIFSFHKKRHLHIRKEQGGHH